MQLARLSQGTAPIRTQIAVQAMSHRDSKDWMLKIVRPYEGPFGVEFYRSGDNKCNLFVYEMLKQAGAPVELQVRRDAIGLENAYPPLAGQWADRDFCIPGFQVLNVPPDVPQPGDVAAIARDSEDATGHVGIVVGPPDSPANMTVSNRFNGVVHNDWAFRGAANDGVVVFRRYVGGAEHLPPPPKPAPPKAWQPWLK